MLIGGNDISNDVITLARFRFTLIGRNLTAQSTGSHTGIGGGIQIPETYLQALLPFPAPAPERPGELAPRLIIVCNSQHTSGYLHSIPET